MNDRKLSPLEMGVLMHCHVSPAPYEGVTPKAMIDAILVTFVGWDVIKPCDDHGGYMTTLKGSAWCRLILSTPMPLACFMDQHGNVIED